MSTKKQDKNGLQSTRQRILARLRGAADWISGEALSRELGVSRAAVSKHMTVLREAGHDIEAAPRRGYRLFTEEAYTEATVRAGLRTRVVGRGTWLWLAETGSTNRRAVTLATEGAPAGSVVVAERQRAGRGRRGKAWFTSPAGLAFSVLLRPASGPAPETGFRAEDVAPLLLRLLAAVAEAVGRETGLAPDVKAPNDLLIKGRKCCGVLVETGAEVDEVAWLVMGIGLNVNARPADFPPELRESATSLAMEKGTRVNRASLLRAVLQALDDEMAGPGA